MKTRWESCVFILLMLLPGIWLLMSTLRPADPSMKAGARQRVEQVHITQAQVERAGERTKAQ